MFVILITSENDIPYLHETPFVSCGGALDAAHELSRDYNRSLVRVFRLGEKLAVARFRKGEKLDA